MRRREVVAGLANIVAGWPLPARAQLDGVRHIAVLMARAANDREGREQAAALERGLAELGWVPGRNITIDYRWHAGDVRHAREFATELATLNPDLLVAASTPSLVAATEATGTMPI